MKALSTPTNVPASMKNWAGEVRGILLELDQRVNSIEVGSRQAAPVSAPGGGVYAGTFWELAAAYTIPSNAICRAHYINCSSSANLTLPNAKRGGWVLLLNVGTGTVTVKNQATTTLVTLATNEQCLIYVRSNSSAVLDWQASPIKWNVSTGTVTMPGAVITGLTPNAFVYAGAAGALTSTAAATDGQVLIGRTGNVPLAAALTGTANRVTVTNGAGSITLSGPQDIHTTASPTFTAVLANTFRPNAAAATALFRGWDTAGVGDPGTDVTLRGGEGQTGMSAVAGGNVHIRGGIGSPVGFVKVYKSNGTTVNIWSNDTGLGFFGVTPVAQLPAYTITNDLTDRAYDADTVTVAELADVVATIYRDLKTLGIFA